jgi:hypothetical protein
MLCATLNKVRRWSQIFGTRTSALEKTINRAWLARILCFRGVTDLLGSRAAVPDLDLSPTEHGHSAQSASERRDTAERLGKYYYHLESAI